MTQLRRQLDSFGPKLVIETGSEEMEDSGRSCYKIQSTNESGLKYHQMHTESGLSRVYADGKLEIQCMAHKTVSPEDTGMAVICWKGNIGVTANSGNIQLSGKNITIEADDTLTLKGNKIKIGASKKETKSVDIVAQKVHIHDPADGNMAYVLKTAHFFKSYMSSLVATEKILSTGAAAAAKKFGGFGF